MARIPLKYLPISGILILLCIIGYFLLRPGNKGVSSTVMTDALPEAGLTIKNPHFSQSPDNGTGFILDADEGSYSKDKQLAILNNFRLQIKPLDSHTLEVKGNRAEYDTSTKVIRLSGNLQASSDNGFKLATEQITYAYDKKDGVLKTDEPVRITGPFFSMACKGLIFYPEKERLEFSDVKTRIEQGR